MSIEAIQDFTVATIEQTVVVTRDEVHRQVISAGSQGPRGPQGEPGVSGAVSVQYPAARALGGHRAVLLTADGADYASADVPEHAGKVAGITLGAAAAGDQVTVQSGADVEEPSWAWDVSRPVYLGVGGALTQTQPTSPTAAFSQILGVPVTPTKLHITLREPISLA